MRKCVLVLGVSGGGTLSTSSSNTVFFFSFCLLFFPIRFSPREENTNARQRPVSPTFLPFCLLKNCQKNLNREHHCPLYAEAWKFKIYKLAMPVFHPMRTSLTPLFEAPSSSFPKAFSVKIRFGREITPRNTRVGFPILQSRTLMAYLRWGKCCWRFLVFSNFLEASSADRRRRMARVCLGRRSRGRYFLFLKKRRMWWRCLALMMVRTRAIDLRRSWLWVSIRD